jgi:fibronectin-binding autotransporter adhesin
MRFVKCPVAAIATVTLIVLVFAATANAGTLYYWYGSDTTLGGAGTWDTGVTTNKAWGVSTGGTSTYWLNTTACDAYFSAASTATVSGDVTLGNLTLAASACTLTTTAGAGTLNIAGGLAVNASVTGGSIGAAVNLLANQTWSVGSGGQVTVTNVVSGGYGIIKTGAGTLTLGTLSATQQSTFTGGFTLQEGYVRYYGPVPFGTGPLTLSGGTLETISPSGLQNAVTATNETNTLLYSRTGSTNNTLGLGTVTGGGTLTLNTVGSRGLGPSNWSTFTGTLYDITSTVDTENSTHIRNVNGGSALATYILNGSGAHLRARWTGDTVTFTTYTVSLGALAGTATGAYLDNRSTDGNVVWSIGALGIDTTYAGHIYDRNSAYGSGSITGLLKTGTATLTLTGTCKFSGGATVENGTLVVNNSFGTTSVSVIGGVLAGSGTFGGNVSVTGGALAPGSSPATMTIAGALSLGTAASLSFELNGADTAPGSGVNDLIQSVTNLTLDGTLNVTETVAGSFLSANIGDTWTLITYSGDLTNNGLELGAMPTLSSGRLFAVDVATPGKVSLMVVVPEPGTLALLASGLFGLIAYAWRKRK